ncbi:MAG: glycosyltransferase [Ruminococcaceae bacterium]|nr:glycosyltransferase [Oscillospiraceae bacterium]
MKKKLLFFAYTLDIGGAEKVLVDFLKVLQPHYDIDLALLQAKGELMQALPDNINVIQMRNGLFSYVLFRYIPFFRKLKVNKIANSKDYYAAIGFIEGRSSTWVADIKKDIRKIAWVHNDVNRFNIGISEKEAIDSYSKMHTVVLVSDEAKKCFDEKYRIEQCNLEVLHNLIDEDKIIQLSAEPVKENDSFTFINVGRMRPQKRQDRLVEIAKRLKEEGFRFKIQIVGDGSEENKIREMIRSEDVSDCVELLGLQLNPYPYIKQADCFVLTSDFEGFGIVVKEAALLGTPVISTDVTGVSEVLHGGKYGILCDVDTDDIYRAMRSVLLSEDILLSFREKLKNYDCSNKAIIDKLFKIIEGK